jgi:saccharopine dehydrogenase (NAD+, L-lysine forming)
MTKTIKIGLIREGKNPPDKRVPLSPKQCRKVLDTFPNIEIFVQPSPVRCFVDADYTAQGIELREDLSNCDILMGVKEVPVDMLIPEKKYFFFSHTIKKQAHNRKLMRVLLDKGITMVDYETITSANNGRLIGFGRYAGIVGTYNALRLYGVKYGHYDLKPAHLCFDRKELEIELKKVKLPADYKIIVSGAGRVGGGCLEILNCIGLKKVGPQEFLTNHFTEAVFTQLHVRDYNLPPVGKSFVVEDFYHDPTEYRSAFMPFAKVGQMYIPCHFWDSRAPDILTALDLKNPELKINIIADISCDIKGPIASTLRPSTIFDPFYGYDKFNEGETDFMLPNAIAVMAVDNLPCELPRDASKDFGETLIEKIFPLLTGNYPYHIIERATICKEGKLTANYAYLEDYAAVKV